MLQSKIGKILRNSGTDTFKLHKLYVVEVHDGLLPTHLMSINGYQENGKKSYQEIATRYPLAKIINIIVTRSMVSRLKLNRYNHSNF